MNRCSIQVVGALVLAGGLSQMPLRAGAQSTPQTPAQSQSAVPDAPAPQNPAPLADQKDQITPGIGSSSSPTTSGGSTTPASSGANPDFTPAPPPPIPDVQKTAPILPESGKGVDQATTIIRSYTNAVEVPVTVTDPKGTWVAGLTYRDFRVYENNKPQRIAFFTVDPFPLSIAFVIDQSLTSDVMAKVNQSLGAIQAALTPYDEAAVFTYNKITNQATGFTGGQSHRLEAVLAINKATGRDDLVPITGGPLSGCSITSNGSCVTPVLQPGGATGGSFEMNLPKEVHPLNDAILEAAKALSTRPIGRRRVLYVISDGKEYGSKATTKEVIRYLQHNKIAVYATVVGDSARWGEGYMSRFHIPFQMVDNVLPKYTEATGGSLDLEKNANGIEKSYQHLAEQARAQYTIVYYSDEPAIDGKYRKIEIRVDRPSKEIEVTAKPGYYPTAQDIH